MPTRFFAAGCVAFLIVLAPVDARTARSAAAVCQPGDVPVDIRDFAFQPPVVTIPQGTTVCWTNSDVISHTVTSDSFIFDSGFLATGETFRFTFNSPGSYPYHCSPHPFMTGTVTVTGSAPANDSWASATDISAGFSSIAGTTVDATGEAGEPNHGGVSLPLNSVWYRFSLPTPRVVQLDTCGSGLNTVLAVYTGSSVGTLTAVASNDDSCGAQSKIIFRAAAGVMYTLAVDGFGSATGPFTLNYVRRVLPSHPRAST